MWTILGLIFMALCIIALLVYGLFKGTSEVYHVSMFFMDMIVGISLFAYGMFLNSPLLIICFPLLASSYIHLCASDSWDELTFIEMAIERYKVRHKYLDEEALMWQNSNWIK